MRYPLRLLFAGLLFVACGDDAPTLDNDTPEALDAEASDVGMLLDSGASPVDASIPAGHFQLSWHYTGQSQVFLFNGNVEDPTDFSFEEFERDRTDQGSMPEYFLLGIFCFQGNESTETLYRLVTYQRPEIGGTVSATFSYDDLAQAQVGAEECLAYLVVLCVAPAPETGDAGFEQKGGDNCFNASEGVPEEFPFVGVRITGEMSLTLPDQSSTRLSHMGPHWSDPERERPGFYGGILQVR